MRDTPASKPLHEMTLGEMVVFLARVFLAAIPALLLVLAFFAIVVTVAVLFLQGL